MVVVRTQVEPTGAQWVFDLLERGIRELIDPTRSAGREKKSIEVE